MEYRVTWSIDLDADSVPEALREASQTLREQVCGDEGMPLRLAVETLPPAVYEEDAVGLWQKVRG